MRIPPASAAEREIEALERVGARLLTLGDPDYPAALAALDDAPPVLSALGDVGLLSRKSVGVVGARNASANGRKLAEMIARDLAAAGYAVVSGLARGVDAAAHRGALPATVAVVAGGIDVVYPPEHEELYRAIAAGGAVVAELPVGTVPQARHFPRRNRLISGLSLGVLVVEAAQRSGSLITARFALEQGREVLAVPGSPLDPRCQGTNHLLRQGAVLTESAADVIAALEGMTPAAPALGPLALEEAEAPPLDDSALAEARRSVAELLGPAPVATDELLRQGQLPAAVVRTVLLELELAGRLERHPGGRVSMLG
jgi:DNA processing protein